MAAGLVQVAPDSTGKKVQTFENTISSNVVEAQAVVLVDTAGAALSPALDASITAAQLVDNAAFTDGTTRVTPAGHILDETAGTALTENDIGAARMDSKRAQVMVIEDATTRGSTNRATVKAASTAAAAADPALVVAISPNNGVATIDGAKATYSASATGIASAATATDIFTLTGSGTKTIRINKVEISGTQTTGGMVTVLLIKRSTADTAGTSAAATAIPHDSSNAAATATALSYTANPTAGTTVGTVRSGKVLIPAPAGTATAPPLVYDFGIRNSQAIVLRGTTQVLAVNLNSTTVTGGSFNFLIEWTEE